MQIATALPMAILIQISTVYGLQINNPNLMKTFAYYNGISEIFYQLFKIYSEKFFPNIIHSIE